VLAGIKVVPRKYPFVLIFGRGVFVFVIIYVAKKVTYTKAVEASAFVLSQMHFSQHMNQGKCFVLF
jgi:hypothetical protein